MKLREYKPEDSKIICSWIKDKESLYKWSADIIDKYPLPEDALNVNYAPNLNNGKFFPLTAVDEEGNVVGHMFIRFPKEADSSIARFGFVIVSPEIRGKGYGKKMLQLAIDYAKNELNAKTASLGVFPTMRGRNIVTKP